MSETKVTGKRKFNPSFLIATLPATKSNLTEAVTSDNCPNSHEPAKNENSNFDTTDQASTLNASSLSPSVVSVLNRSITAGNRSEWSRSVNASFRNVLYQYVGHDVRENDSEVVFSNDIASLVLDAYPKAAVHLLLLPKESYLSVRQVRDLHTSQLGKLQQFHSLAREISAAIEQGDQSCQLISPKWHQKLRNLYMWNQPLKCGYHSIPSLFPLHLHIISTDFISPTLKNKGHWNKFTTEFFLQIDEVERLLTSKDRDILLQEVMPDEETLELVLRKPLTCHHCGEIFPNIPKLKWHIEDCMTST